MNFLIQGLLAVVASVAVFVAGVNIPVSKLSITDNSGKLGTVGVATISTATNLADFPTIYNTAMSLLDNGKIDSSTTTVPTITTLSALATVGTITSGTWSGTAIAVSKGGTGTTSPTSNYVMLGDGSSGFKVVSGLGSNGEVLTSAGAGNPPAWGSSSVNETLAYDWTGLHSFAATTTMATSTQASTTITYDLNMTGGLLNVLKTGNATSTVSANLVVGNNASTTNLMISGYTFGGPMYYTGSSTAVALSSGTQTFTGSIPTNANTMLVSYSMSRTAVGVFSAGVATITRSGLSSARLTYYDPTGTQIKDYTVAWSGNNLVVTEDTDVAGSSDISLTAYYYK